MIRTLSALALACLLAGFTPTSSTADTPNPEDEVRAEVLMRCVLFGAERQHYEMARSWGMFARSAEAINAADTDKRREIFPAYVRHLREQVAAERDIDTTRLGAELYKSFDQFDFSLVKVELDRITVDAMSRWKTAEARMNQNNERLAAASSPALQADLTQACGRP